MRRSASVLLSVPSDICSPSDRCCACMNVNPGHLEERESLLESVFIAQHMTLVRYFVCDCQECGRVTGFLACMGCLDGQHLQVCANNQRPFKLQCHLKTKGNKLQVHVLKGDRDLHVQYACVGCAVGGGLAGAAP